MLKLDKFGTCASIQKYKTGKTLIVYNKVKKVTTDDLLTIRYIYDGAGNRVMTIRDENNENGLPQITAYTRDATGNTMAVYDATGHESSAYGNPVNERYIYGSSRIGVDRTGGFGSYTIGLVPKIKDLTRTRYELTNHLGNVLATVTGRKLGQPGTDPNEVDHYLPEFITATDFYPFGQQMPGRIYTNQDYNNSPWNITNDYRYAFNGKELDKSGEFGSLAHYDYGFRIYNPSIGKFLSVDPLTKEYPMLTPYQFASNRPIDGIDLDGLEYLRADESRVELKFGELKLKVENLYFPNRKNWEVARQNSSNWNGGVGLNRTIGKVDLITPRQSTDNGATGIAQLDPNPGATDPASNPSTVTINPRLTQQSNFTEPDKRVNPKYFLGGSPGLAPKGAKGALGISMLNMVADEYFKWTFFLDKGKMDKHTQIAQKSLDLVTAANNSGSIPPEYQNTQSLINIANVVLQGVNNTDDPKIYELGMKIYNDAQPKNSKAKSNESTYKLTVTDNNLP